MTAGRVRLRFLLIGALALVGAATFAGSGDARTADTPPSNTAVPTISGTLVIGSGLTADSGSWSGTTPISFTYRWQRCDNTGAGCVNIVGANQSSYQVKIADAGSTLRVQVTAQNSAGSATALSAHTGVVPAASPPVNSTLPQISGTLAVGSNLTVSKGSWTGATPITYTYQWRRCDTGGSSCSDIGNQTSNTHTIVTNDVGHTLRVVVTATNSGGSGQATTAATNTIGDTAPANSALPSISGSSVLGQTLSVSNGSWVGSNPISYTYQWQRCDSSGNNCSSISGATSASYALASADSSHTLRAVVTAKNTLGSTSATSAASAVVTANAPANTAAPAVSGTATEGATLTVSTGTWIGAATISYSYVWQRCDTSGNNCVTIPGATGTKYTLAAADVGHTIHAIVTASNSAGENRATAAASGTVTSSLPAGGVKLPNGKISVPVATIAPTDHLRISGVALSPRTGSRAHSRVVITFTVADTANDVVNGALVHAMAIPPSWASKVAEQRTSVNGTVAITIAPTKQAPRNGVLYLFVQARVPGGKATSLTTGGRLVTVRLRP